MSLTQVQHIGYVLAAAVLLGGCATPGDTGPSGAFDAAPLGMEIDLDRGGGSPAGALGEAREADSLTTLTLPQALELALSRNRALRAAAWEIQAGEARARQAGVLRNPELEVEAEEFGGTGDFSGFGGMESGLTLKQHIELGGKRKKRRTAARLEAELLVWDYQAQRQDLLAATAGNFMETLVAQRRVELAQGALAVAEETRDVLAKRVAAGRASPLAETKAGVDVSASRIRLEKARSAWRVAGERLAVNWGGTPGVEQVQGDLEPLAEPRQLAVLGALLDKSPERARWEAVIRLREAQLKLEESRKTPDINLKAGVRHFRESDDQALVVGFELPLQIFDRNQDGIEAAKHGLSQAYDARMAAGTVLRARLAMARQEMLAAYKEAGALRREVLPAAEAALDAARVGFGLGKFGYLEVLDAQGALFEAREQYLESLQSYHESRISVERLIAESAKALEPGKSEGVKNAEK